jgi:hypothetical protein
MCHGGVRINERTGARRAADTVARSGCVAAVAYQLASGRTVEHVIEATTMRLSTGAAFVAIVPETSMIVAVYMG